jgi:16S rRNA (uracil1498-N3)-methyltransferase
LIPDCDNDGGLKSIFKLNQTLDYEKAVELPECTSAALQSWQARIGEAFTVIDSQGDNWRARLSDRDGIHYFIPFEKLPGPVESPVWITVFQAIPEKERFELVLQKLTELGVCRIVPMETARSITRDQRDAGQKKSHRWPEVLLKAARQCRRAMVPELAPVAGWEDTLSEASRVDSRMLLYEGNASWSLNELLYRQTPDSIALLIGPEGGFTEQEAEQAHGRGIVPVSLGPRILRTETAAIAAAAAVQYAVGDLATGKR